MKHAVRMATIISHAETLTATIDKEIFKFIKHFIAEKH